MITCLYIVRLLLLLLLESGRSNAKLRSYNFTIHSGSRAPGRSPIREIRLFDAVD